MSRAAFVLLLLSAFGLVQVGMLGCSSSKSDEGDDGSDKPTVADRTGGGNEDETAGIADWPEPELALVLTGEQKGFLEPCGCTEGQSGGISRRANLVQRLVERDWTLAGLDLGGTVARHRRQSQIKFETMLDAMEDMGYAALGLGPAELRLGPDFLLAKHQPDESIAFLAANVVLYDSPELGTPARWKMVEAGDRKVGVTAVLGQSLHETVFPKDADTAISMLGPADSLPQVLDEMKQADPDMLVLLSFSSIEESKALAKRFPEFDLLVSAGGPEDPLGEPEWIDNTMLVTVGQKGKHVGVVGFYPEESTRRLRFALVELKADRFDHDRQMVKHMRYYHERLREEQLAARELPIAHASGATFVGAETCGECHTTAYEIWKNTPHAHAFESLRDSRPGEADYNFTREFDPECLACHVTGWHPQEVLRYDGGFINEEFAETEAEKRLSRLLKGQQCESCHGPGSRHVELVNEGELQEARKLVRVTIKEAREKLCVQCHDLDNSPNFDFGEYWPQVEHYGLD